MWINNKWTPPEEAFPIKKVCTCSSNIQFIYNTNKYSGCKTFTFHRYLYQKAE